MECLFLLDMLLHGTEKSIIEMINTNNKVASNVLATLLLSDALRGLRVELCSPLQAPYVDTIVASMWVACQTFIFYFSLEGRTCSPARYGLK